MRSGWASGLVALFWLILPWLVLIGIYWVLWRRMLQSVGGAFGGRRIENFLSGDAQQEQQSERKVTCAGFSPGRSPGRRVCPSSTFASEFIGVFVGVGARRVVAGAWRRRATP